MDETQPTTESNSDRPELPNPLENSPFQNRPKIISFRELCRCGDEVWIENDGQLYRLRRTRLGKLILTK